MAKKIGAGVQCRCVQKNSAKQLAFCFDSFVVCTSDLRGAWIAVMSRRKRCTSTLKTSNLSVGGHDGAAPLGDLRGGRSGRYGREAAAATATASGDAIIRQYDNYCGIGKK